MFNFYPGLPHILQIARKLHSDLHPMQMIKMNSYHNLTLFVDDEKVFVAGSEDHRVSTFSKSRIYKSFGVMHNKAVQVNGEAGSFL